MVALDSFHFYSALGLCLNFLNRISVPVGFGNHCVTKNGKFRITGNGISVSAVVPPEYAVPFPFPFPFCKIPFPFPYFHSVSVFPRKSQKVSAPFSSLG